MSMVDFIHIFLASLISAIVTIIFWVMLTSSRGALVKKTNK